MSDAELIAFGREMRGLIYPLRYDGDGEANRQCILDSTRRRTSGVATATSEVGDWLMRARKNAPKDTQIQRIQHDHGETHEDYAELSRNRLVRLEGMIAFESLHAC
jgi:hypothetical protein